MRPFAFAVVRFDDTVGQFIDTLVPADVELSERERDAVRFHAFPESASLAGDAQFSFRMKAPLRAGEAAPSTTADDSDDGSVELKSAVIVAESTHLFGHVFFRMVRDRAFKRGSVSAAVVLLVRYPFVALYKRVMQLVGTAFFESAVADGGGGGGGGGGEAVRVQGSVDVLEAAMRELAHWPLPRFAAQYELPLLGHVLLFRAPPVRGVASILDSEQGGALAALGCASLVSNLDAVNVYESFSTMVPHLWLLWELVLTGAPLMIYASDAAAASDAVYAALSLIAPLEYGGEVQPYFVIQDDTFRAYSANVKGGPLPSAVIGTSNPFFFTALAHWPHVVSVGETELDDGVALLGRRGTTRNMSQVRAPSSNRARALAGREQSRPAQTIASTRSALVAAPRDVLAKLIDARNVMQRESLARVDSWERLRPGAQLPSSAASSASSSASSFDATMASPTVAAIGDALHSAANAISHTSSAAYSSLAGFVSSLRRTAVAADDNAAAASAAAPTRWSIKISFGGAADEPKKEAAEAPVVAAVAPASTTTTTTTTVAASVEAPAVVEVVESVVVAPSSPVAAPAATPLAPLSPLVEMPTIADSLPEVAIHDDDGVVVVPSETKAVQDAVDDEQQTSATTATTTTTTPLPPSPPVPTETTEKQEAAPRVTSIESEDEDSMPLRWSAQLTNGLANAAELASEVIWPKEVTPVSVETYVQHNNAVLRSHFLQLTNTFLAPFESYILALVGRGKVAAFAEKEFLEYVRANRPMRQYSYRDEAVVELYSRFCRSINFHVYYTTRLDAISAVQRTRQQHQSPAKK